MYHFIQSLSLCPQVPLLLSFINIFSKVCLGTVMSFFFFPLSIFQAFPLFPKLDHVGELMLYIMIVCTRNIVNNQCPWICTRVPDLIKSSSACWYWLDLLLSAGSREENNYEEHGTTQSQCIQNTPGEHSTSEGKDDTRGQPCLVQWRRSEGHWKNEAKAVHHYGESRRFIAV